MKKIKQVQLAQIGRHQYLENGFCRLDEEGKETNLCFQRIIGGLGWPGSRPGFAVVIGEEAGKRPPYKYHLIAEAEASSLEELLEATVVLRAETHVQRFCFRPDNQGQEFYYHFARQSRKEGVNPPSLITVNDEFGFCLQLLRASLSVTSKSLFLLPDSRLPAYLMALPDNISTLKESEYPAVAALGLGFSYLRKHEFSKSGNTEIQDWNPYDYL